MALSGNNELANYGDGPRRSRSRGTVYVDEPAKGFFVTGSSLSGLNGIYSRIARERCVLRGGRVVHLAYKHEASGWTLVLGDGVDDDDDDGYGDYSPKGPEWVFVDETKRERLVHKERNTLIPGAGTRWAPWPHGTSGGKSGGPFDDASDDDASDDGDESSRGRTQVVKKQSAEDAEDELPWQVIALLDMSIVNDLRYSSRWRDQNVSKAMAGLDLPRLQRRSLAQLDREKKLGDGAWLYRITTSCPAFEEPDADSPDADIVARGEYVRVVNVRPGWLGIDSGAWVEARHAARCEAPLHLSGEMPRDIDDADADFDKPFESRILDENAEPEAAADDDDARGLFDDDGDSEADAGRGDCQRGRTFAALESAWLVGLAAPDLDGAVVQVLAPRSPESSRCSVLTPQQKRISLHSSNLAKSFLATPPSESGGRLEDDAWVLGAVVGQSAGSINAAWRACERDAQHDARLNAQPAPKAGAAQARRRLARDRLIAAAARDPQAEPAISPLVTLLRGDLGSRAQDVAARLTVAGATSMAAIDAALGALRQIICDASSAAQAGDECTLRCALAQALLDHDRDAEAQREAKLAAELFPVDAGPMVLLGTCGFRASDRCGGAKLFSEAAHSRAGDAWAPKCARDFLRAARRAHGRKRIADDAYSRGAFAAAADAYGQALDHTQGCAADKWLRAVLHSNRAACRRRARSLKLALEDADAALSLCPRYARAAFRRACILLEANEPARAKAAFVQVLRLDRSWPHLCEWLVRAEAQAKRAQGKKARKAWHDDEYGASSDDEASSSPNKAPPKPAADENGQHLDFSDESVVIDHFTVLGVTADVGDSELKRAYRLRSLKYHPDRAGGSTVAFQRVNDAFTTLSDPVKRAAYEMGEDLGKKHQDDSDDSDREESSLREQVERNSRRAMKGKYFPERYEFWPFGDPYVEKRRIRARRSKEQAGPAWHETY